MTAKPALRFGQDVRTRCTATGRYIGWYGGQHLALFISAQDNDLCVDTVDRSGQPHPSLPVPTDRELCAAAVGIRYGLHGAPARLSAGTEDS